MSSVDSNVPSNKNQQAVHIGPGNFALGHIIPFYQGIGIPVRAISLRSSTTKDLISDSDYDFDLVSRGSEGPAQVQRITALKDIVVVPPKTSNGAEEVRNTRRQEAIALISDPATSIVSMTVTIDGYGYQFKPGARAIDPLTGRIVESIQDSQSLSPIPNSQAEIDSDTTIAFLAAGLNERMKAGSGPLVVMSLDNLPLNGTNLYRAVKDFALQNYGNDLYQWIKGNTFFPDTMVDRIVPKQNEKTRSAFLDGAELDSDLLNPVVTEPLPSRALVISTPGQSVLERAVPLNPELVNNNIIAALTQLDGVEQCEMANLYSERKVHVFNGAHFGLAMVGRLAGYEYAHEAIQDPAIREFIEKLLDELIAGAPPELGESSAHYKQEFIERVGNPHMQDELQRIGRNGSSKLFERVMIPWYIASKAGQGHEAIDMVAAAWIKNLSEATAAAELGIDYDIEDPNAFELGLVGLEQQLYEDAHSIFGIKGVMDKTPGREEFGNDVNAAMANLGRVLSRSSNQQFIGPAVPFERPAPGIKVAPNS